LVHLPNSMLRVHPLKKDEFADQLSGFPLTVVSHRIGSAFSFLPVFAEGDPWQSSITIHRQNAHPYAYEVVDAATYNSVAVTPSEKSGIFRMTNADRSTTHRLRFSVINATGFVESHGGQAFSGEEDYNGMKVYFYGTVDGTVKNVETGGDDSRRNVVATVESANGVLEMRYGISFISVDQAKANLEQEIGDRDFAATKAAAMDVWRTALSKIKVKGSEEHKRVFYTALYRTYERMVDINEHGRYY